MSTETMGPEALLGQLRDTGLSTVLVNRIGELLGLFGSNVPQFCALSKAALEAAYVKAHPGTKGLGKRTYEAFDRFVRLWKQSLYDAKQVARATVEEQERKAAEKAGMRQEILDTELDSDTLLKVMEAFEHLGRKRFSLGQLLNIYQMVEVKA